MKEKLTAELERFKEIVETYGAREEAWPADDLPMMQRLLDTSDVARSLLRQEAKIDLLLQQESRVPPASAALLGRVLTSAEEINQGSFLKSLWPFGALWQPAAGMVMAACIGIFLGFASPDIITGTDEDTLNTLVFSSTSLMDLENDYENL